MPPCRLPRHEVFAQAMSRGGSQADACREAGYDPKHGDRLAKNGDIKRRRAELLAPVVRALNITQESMIDRFEEMARLAAAKGQYGPAINALREMAILAGLRVEKRENLNRNADIRDLSADELAREIAGLEARAIAKGEGARVTH